MAATFLADILRPHVNLQEFGGWQTYGGSTFTPAGIIIHHTAGRNDLNLCINGRSDLPGPLCNLYFDRDAPYRVTLVSGEAANHAGSGSSRVLDEVRRGVAAGPDAAARGLVDDLSGNRYFYGFECENLGDGKEIWPFEQALAMVNAAAAICRHHGWNAGHVIGHREWTRRKIDPRGFTMSGFRAAVQSVLDSPLEDDMPLTTDELNLLNATYGKARDAVNYGVANEASIAALRAEVARLAAPGVDMDALAEKVADALARRLAS